jgi:hypothetical protein
MLQIRRSIVRALLVVSAALFAAASAFPQTRTLGPVLVSELAIGEGRMAFTVDSNGCTDARSFEVDVRREPGTSPSLPHYRLTIRRTRIDECKAILWDGVRVELDLEKDVGLTGSYTLSVENPLFPRYRRTE